MWPQFSKNDTHIIGYIYYSLKIYPTIYFLQEKHLIGNDTYMLRVKWWKQSNKGIGAQNQAGMALLSFITLESEQCLITQIKTTIKEVIQ